MISDQTAIAQYFNRYCHIVFSVPGDCTPNKKLDYPMNANFISYSGVVPCCSTWIRKHIAGLVILSNTVLRQFAESLSRYLVIFLHFFVVSVIAKRLENSASCINIWKRWPCIATKLLPNLSDFFMQKPFWTHSGSQFEWISRRALNF